MRDAKAGRIAALGLAWAAARVLALGAVLEFGEVRVAAAARALTPAAPAPDSISTMSLGNAYAAAERLVGSRRHLESLPFFRRMIALVPADDWSLRHDYSNALQGASMQSRTLHGLPLRAVRSSYESIQLMRAALEQLNLAQGFAPTPRAAASVHLARTRQFAAWGLPCDAWAEARAAASADASWDLAGLAARQWTRRMASGFLVTEAANTAASAATRPPPRGGRR
jgi:hypothetical protein